MSPSKSVLKVAIAATALTALGLVAASPASAHTNNMYTFVYLNFDEVDPSSGFATYGKTDGVATKLATSLPFSESLTILGIEVAAEKGTVLGFRGETYFVDTWNHTTGEPADVPMAVANPGADNVLWYTGLDTLNDGTTVTLSHFEIQDGDSTNQFWAVGSLNSGTGEFVPLVDLTDAVVVQDQIWYGFSSLATDPATGITYVFLQNEDHQSFYLEVNVAAETVGEPTLFQSDDLEDGWMLGADFDAGDGTLYMNYENHAIGEGEDQLLRFGVPSTWATADPTLISEAPSNDAFIEQRALTIEHTALAATGSELPIAAWLLVGTVAVLAGGATVMVARRRAEAGTV